jgi:putative hemolysin
VDILIAIVVIIVVTVLAAVMSATEAATALLSPSRIHRLVESEQKGAAALESLTERAYRFRSSAAFTSALAYAAGCTATTWALVRESDGTPAWLAALLGALVGLSVVFSFGHALPRTLGVRNPEGVALAFAGWGKALTRAFYPFAKVLGAVWSWLMGLAVGERPASAWVTEDEYRSGTSEDEETAREETEEALIEAVSDLADKVVREVMVPRTDMTCLEDDATALDAIRVIEAAGYSRLPVYHETLDDITGVLYAKDLLSAYSRDASVVPAGLVRKAFFVPETKPVQELLMEMRARTHIAIVADEYGGTAGLVTIEDLLEEIVGEIFDEYDSAVQLVVELGDGRFQVDARLPVDDLNERFGTAIEMDADTVGGVVTEVAGRIPEPGDTVEIEGLRLRVTELEGTRIRQLVVESAGNHESGREHA